MTLQVPKYLLALLATASLAACGGSSNNDDGGDNGNPQPQQPEAIDIQVTQASRTLDNRLPCYQGTGDAACNLRIYQVMVESFIDGDPDANYGTGYGTSHHNGDIAGITASLDYIKSLGMNAIWLTPIFESIPVSGQSQWVDRLDATGYYTSDYFSIDPNFGTLEQARELVEQAHAKGMYVFFDGVFGHHKGNVVASPEGRTPTNGTAISNIGYESEYPTDLEFYKEVATYWVNELNIDGWRLDQAYQVPAEYWDDIREAVEEASADPENAYSFAGETVQPLGYMVAEIWRGAGDIAAQGYGMEASPALKSAFDFPIRYSVVQTFAVEESGNGNRDASNLDTGFFAHLAYPEHAKPNLMLGNHDLVRFGDLLQRGDIANPSDAEYWARHKGAISFLAAYSGPITLYYGEEIGDEVPNFADRIENCTGDTGLCDDHVARTSANVEGIATTVGAEPTVLTSEQSDLKNYVGQLMNIRAANPALYNGSRTHIHSDADIYIDRKDAGDNHVLYLVNTKDNDVNLTIAGSAIGSDGDLINLMTGETLAIAGTEYTLSLPAHSAAFYQISSPTAEGPQLGSGGEGANLTGTGPLAACDAPDATEAGPLGTEMYIRGTYTGGEGFGATPASHQFSYKGDNIYQVVIDETTPTAYTFKFAAPDWSFEYAVEDSAAVDIGQEQIMTQAIGPGTESSILIPEAGSYVYSFAINAALDGGTMMVSKCE